MPLGVLVGTKDTNASMVKISYGETEYKIINVIC